MKRLCISIAIMLCVVFICVYSVSRLKEGNRQLFDYISRTRQAYLENKDAAPALEQLTEYWKKHFLLLSYTTTGSGLEQMSLTVAKLPRLMQSRSAEFLGELDALEHWAKLVYDNNYPRVSAIF